MSTGYKYLRPEDVRRMANYRLAAQMMVEGWMSGKHRAKGRGSSSDFLEYRQYAQGDDLRLIDWRVFARTDRHYLKTFEHETHLECHIFVDSSASMDYLEKGPMTKLEYASFFAACLSWIVVKSNDLTSLTLFDESIRQFIPPGSTRKHLDLALTLLEKNTAGGPTSLSDVLMKTRPLLQRRGTLVIVSDFLEDPAKLFQALNPYLHSGFKITLLQVLDEGESELTNAGAVRFQDMESGQKIVFNTAQIKEAYRDKFQKHRQTMHSLAMAQGVKFISVTTNQSYYTVFDELSST